MVEPYIKTDEIRLEAFKPDRTERVADLIAKFLKHKREAVETSDTLGLVFNLLADVEVVDSIVDGIFENHPELEDSRREIDDRWLDSLPEDIKRDVEQDKIFLEDREVLTRYRVTSESPYASLLDEAEIEHHLARTYAQHRIVANYNE